MKRLVFGIECGEHSCGECEHLWPSIPKCLLLDEFLDREADLKRQATVMQQQLNRIEDKLDQLIEGLGRQ